MRLKRLSTIASVIVGGVCTQGVALGSGLELMPGGSESVARGGAVAARAEDPAVIGNDPAGLALLPNSEVMLQIVTAIPHMCVKPYGYYGWGAYNDTSEFGDPLAVDNPQNPTIGATYATTPLPKVCNSAPIAALPNLVFTTKISKDFGIGAGFMAPVEVPGLQFGASDGTISTDYGVRPTPTRYSLVKEQVEFGLDPTIGAGYRPIKQLAIGLQLQVLMVKAKAVAVQNAVAGTQPGSDWLATLETKDFFIPSVTFSVHAKPIRPLDLVVAFKYTESFDGSGTVTYETNTFDRGASAGNPIPYANQPISIKDIRIGMPWKLTGAARYAGLLSKKSEGGLGDPMDTELWDVEVDVSTELAGLARNTINVGGAATVDTRVAGGGTQPTTVQNLGATTIDPHRKTAYTARLGGSYAFLPRTLVVHAGTFFESRSVDPAYADIDTFAFQRIGLGLGGVLRVGDFDLQLGYGHIFSETLDVAPPPHQNAENARPGDPRSGFDQRVGGSFGPDGTRQGGTVLPDPGPSNPDGVASKTQVSAVSTQARPERVINAGKYTASFDVISLGAVYHF